MEHGGLPGGRRRPDGSTGPERCVEHPLADGVRSYYAARVAEYDVSAGYLDPAAERSREPLKRLIAETFRDREVLEVACGTGYWTAAIAAAARSVLATDASAGMLAVAERRLAGAANVEVALADAYCLEGVPRGFSGGFAHWWLSHVPKSLLGRFLETFHRHLGEGAAVLFIDHLPYEWWRRRAGGRGDTLETRTLSDGRAFEIVKNFLGRDELAQVVAPWAEDVEYSELTGSWTLRYRVGACGASGRRARRHGR